MKEQLNPVEPRRDGIGIGQCEATHPTTTCADPDALSDPIRLLFYQVLSACGPLDADEGPVF